MGRGFLNTQGGDLIKHVLAVLVNNHPGVLSRVAGLFSRRGFNIESLAVGTTEDPDISRITIVVDGDDYVLNQISLQLYKLVDVIKVQDLGKTDYVGRELVLFKVAFDSSNRDDIMHIIEIFRAKVIDVSRNSMVIEATGDLEKISALEELLRQFEVLEIVRTGLVSLERGDKVLKEYEEEINDDKNVL